MTSTKGRLLLTALLALATAPAAVRGLKHDDSDAKPKFRWPMALYNRNLLIVGDSIDREFAKFMCTTFKGKMQTVTATPWIADEGNVTMHLPDNAPILLCSFPETVNSSMAFFYNVGAMAEAPQPSWWNQQAQETGRWHDHMPALGAVKAIKRKKTPKGNFGGWVDMDQQVVSVTDFSQHAWPYYIKANMPARPAVLMIQSSLWDSVLWHEANTTTQGVDNMTLQSMDWLGHVETMIKAVKHSGISLAETPDGPMILWRNNPDCPFHNPDVSYLSQAMSGLVRESIKAKYPPVFAGVHMVDFRDRYWATHKEDCVNIHYPPQGYAALLSAFVDATRGLGRG